LYQIQCVGRVPVRVVTGNWRISREISGIDSSVKNELELPAGTIDDAAEVAAVAGALSTLSAEPLTG